jgi:hypothetical protein
MSTSDKTVLAKYHVSLTKETGWFSWLRSWIHAKIQIPGGLNLREMNRCF